MLRRLAALVVFCLLLAPFAPDAQARSGSKSDAKKSKAKEAGLTAAIDKLLSQPDIARGFWGIEVVSLETGKTLYSHNADRLFTPASNTKLFTTTAAIALIGPNYRFKTTVESNGTIDKHGRLNGDLMLIGRGDPNLSGRTLPYNLRTERKDPPVHVLQELADQVVADGVKYI